MTFLAGYSVRNLASVGPAVRAMIGKPLHEEQTEFPTEENDNHLSLRKGQR